MGTPDFQGTLGTPASTVQYCGLYSSAHCLAQSSHIPTSPLQLALRLQSSNANGFLMISDDSSFLDPSYCSPSPTD